MDFCFISDLNSELGILIKGCQRVGKVVKLCKKREKEEKK
jgi:hypothetical protein